MARSQGFTAAALLLVAAFGLLSVTFVGPAPQQPRSTSLRASRADSNAMGAPEAMEEPEQQTSPLRFCGAALSVLAAFALAVLPMEEAQAAKSGGRIGGSAPSMRRAPPPRPAAAPPAATSKTTVINKTTVIAPPPPVVVAPPVVGYGGVGMMGAPVVVAPPPTLGDVVVGTVVGGAINNAMYGGMHHSGPSTTDRFLENQQRQDERQMDNQAREIDQLKSDLLALKAQKQ